MKSIKSTDERKKAIVAAFKARSGGTKVTSVKEDSEGNFHAHCLKATWEGKGGAYRMPNYESLGVFCLAYGDIFNKVEGAA